MWRAISSGGENVEERARGKCRRGRDYADESEETKTVSSCSGKDKDERRETHVQL
jgi:hypothetical protein